ncbi:MAG: YihY family inner membrane protein [Gammaproteobacteria bacterium]|nr:YihY family inner membrane protein [Gammaproteobacteria bacterium]MBQ0840314.1 YihY family inner membrane protein [Gammaproteobacteria bacterium]
MKIFIAFLLYLKERYKRDGCQESAAALTYMTLFAVVPLMTMMYSMFAVIPAFQGFGDQVEQLIFENLVPSSGIEVQTYLREFSSQARELSVVGGFILIVTSYLMLSNIEKTFNRIWQTAGGRQGLSSFLLYWGVLSFGPLLIGLGLLMHTYLLSFQLLVDEFDTFQLSAAVLQYLPWLMSWAGFTLLFVAMPNCRVVFRHALWGGLITTLFFQVAKGLFALFVVNSSYNTIYGAFAIVPMFLLWVYLCWVIVLGGAELIRALETFRETYRPCYFPDLIAVLVICVQCLDSQSRGEAIADRDMLKAGLDERQWSRLRSLLLEKKILMSTASNRYVLTHDPAKLTLWDINSLLGGGVFSPLSERGAQMLGQYPWSSRLETTLDAVSHQASEQFSLSLQDLFDAHDCGLRGTDAAPQN